MRILNLVVALMLCGSVVGSAHADGDSERRELTKLVHELAVLEPLIVKAELAADPDARVRFQYDWLRQDLARVRLGIEEHINAPQAEPRRFPPLRSDYRR